MAKNKRIAGILIGTVAIIIALSLLFALNSNQILRAFGVSKPAPVFTFNESKAPNWWAAVNYNSQASSVENYEGIEPIDKLPVASMNVFKGKKGEYATDCFVMFSYYDYKADVTQLKKDKDSESLASATMNNIGENTVSIDALGTVKKFTVTKYELIGKDAENAMKGMSYGWAELGEGHIAVSAVCPTGSELDGVFTAIGAVSLVKQ